MVNCYKHNDITRLTLRPNSSSSMSGILWWLIAFSGTTVAIAMAWALVGVWLILPFAVLEAVLVGFFLIRVYQSSCDSQILIFEPSVVHIILAAQERQRRVSLVRSDIRALAALDCEPDHEILRLCDHAHWAELGEFLTTNDRRSVIAHLRALGVPITSMDAGSIAV